MQQYFMIVVYLPIFTTIKQIKTIMKKKNLFLKSTSSLLAMLFVVMSAFMFTACDPEEEPTPDEEPEPENSIAEIIASSDNHTQLAAYLELYPNLIDVISDTTASLTVFAPNNDAFATLEGTLNTDLENVSPAVIEAVLAFHVHTGGAVLRADITENTELSTAQGENITFNADGNVATGGSVDDVPYDGDEILANNGVVHSVGNILIPPAAVFSVVAEHLGKVSQAILLGADFTTLAAAIDKADEFAEGAGQPTLKSILSDESATLTVFAPVNQVFEAGGITLDAFTGQQWYGLIANHVLTEKVLAADLTSGNVYSTAAASLVANASITVLPSGGLDSNGWPGAEASIAAPDAFESQINGVVHAIAGVLTLPVPNPNITGTYTVTGTGCAGDGAGNCSADGTFELPESTVTIDATTTVGLHDVSDIMFGHYLAFYSDGDVNPGQLMTNADGTISITDQDDVVYGGDVINGSGIVNADGTIEISISNNYGDSGDFVLTPNAGRPVTSDMISNIKKVQKK